MKQLSVPGFFSWSVFNSQKQMDFNGHVWVRPEGNVVIDPVRLTDEDAQHLESLGGAKLCVVTNADHKREVPALVARFGCEVVAHALDAPALDLPNVRAVKDGEAVVPDMFVVHLEHGKTPGELALWLPALKTVVTGDALQGAPVGALRLPPDAKLKDPPRAALELRKILRLPLENLLVGDGHSLFTNARDAIVNCLETRDDIDIHRVRPSELGWTSVDDKGRYRHEMKELSRLVGARKLAYNLRKIPPGGATGPLHFHRAEEELFMVVEGRCDLESPRGITELLPGDLVACPAGEMGAHALVNRSDKPCVVLCLSDVVPNDTRELAGITDFRDDLVSP